MKKQLFFLILCIGLLLSGCQKTPEAQPAAQSEKLPWETESQNAPLSYAEYFAEIRTYDTADYAYTPAWLQTGKYEIDCIDGKLALYRTSDGERLTYYAKQPFLSWRTGDTGVYVFRDQEILCCTYDGSREETLYAVQDGTIISFTAAGDVLFFAEKTAESIRLCRLYALEKRLDILYDAISPDAQELLLFPVSNHELCWSMDNPEFLELAAEQKQTYIETRNIDPDDRSTYWGMLELDFRVNSGIRYYYNDLTQELRSQEFRIIYGEESGVDWWKTAESHTERLGFTGGNIAQGGLMAGDGEWIYYRSERNHGLYKARTDGSKQTQLLPPEEYEPRSINVLDGWVYFSNVRDGFSIWRVRCDGTDVEKLVSGNCPTLYVSENGIYYEILDKSSGQFMTFREGLALTDSSLLSLGSLIAGYYDGTLYSVDLQDYALYAFRSPSGTSERLYTVRQQAAYFSADHTGLYFWDDSFDYCRLDPDTKEVTILYEGPVGDYFNFFDGTIYYCAYGGKSNDFACCYALDAATGVQTPILSLSAELYDADGNPVGITQADYRARKYDPSDIPTNMEGWPIVLSELVDGLYVVNGQVFAHGRLAQAGMQDCWILCNGGSGTLWEEG